MEAAALDAAIRLLDNQFQNLDVFRPTNSQKPWSETLVTSTREVLEPCAADFIEVGK